MKKQKNPGPLIELLALNILIEAETNPRIDEETKMWAEYLRFTHKKVRQTKAAEKKAA